MQCAGVIHTDFEKGFIRAEVIKYDDYVAYGGEQGVKEAGKLGVEGKEYVGAGGFIFFFAVNGRGVIDVADVEHGFVGEQEQFAGELTALSTLSATRKSSTTNCN